jgi:colanic acid biosynthesis glycosyl transferase WcaI
VSAGDARVAPLLIHSLVFAPDGPSTAQLLTSLTIELRALGHDVVVLTSTPHYAVDPAALQQHPLRRVVPGLLYRSNLGQTPVWHVKLPRKQAWLPLRLYSFVVFHVLSFWFGLFVTPRGSTVFAVSPPPTLGLVGLLLARLRGGRLVYNVQEMYPDFMINQGMLRSPLLIRLARWLEAVIYRNSAAVITAADGFRERVIARGATRDRVFTIPNFHLVTPVAGKQPRPAGFVAFYGGNIGLSQDWELLLDVAAGVQDRPITFVITGTGVRSRWLAAEAASRGLHNVDVRGFQPEASVPDLYAAADVLVMPMKALTCYDTFPSKIFSSWASGVPVLAAAEADSDLACFVTRATGGAIVAPGDVASFEAALRALERDRTRARELGEHGRTFVQRYSSADVAGQIDTVIRRIPES